MEDDFSLQKNELNIGIHSFVVIFDCIKLCSMVNRDYFIRSTIVSRQSLHSIISKKYFAVPK